MVSFRSFIFFLFVLFYTIHTSADARSFVRNRNRNQPRAIFPDIVLQPNIPVPAVPTTNNLVEELSSWSDADVLISLVSEFPDLVEAALSKDPLLVFAPTNDAFLTIVKLFFPNTPQNAPPAIIVKQLKTIWARLTKLKPSLPTLKDVLLFHIVAGNLPEYEIVRRGSLKTLLGKNLGTRSYPRSINDFDNILNSRRLGLQIRTTNGRISFIDNLLIPFDVARTLASVGIKLPPSAKRVIANANHNRLFKPFRSLVDFATSRNDIKILTAIVANDKVLLNLVAKTKSLHIFAPTDTAFVELITKTVPEKAVPTLLPKGVKDTLANPEELNAFVQRLVKTIGSAPGLATVREIISYHVVSTTASYHMLVGEGKIPTLFRGLPIEVSKSGVKDLDPVRPDAKKIASFGTRNGFVTVIDSVLVPINVRTVIKAIAKVVN